MRTIAKLLLPLCLFVFACGAAPKAAPEPPPPAPEPEPPPEWKASAETCGQLMGKMIELAETAELADVVEELKEGSGNDKVIAECVETVNKEQFDCVMATTEFKALADCQEDEE